MTSMPWNDMFVLSIPIWEKIVRVIAIYLFLIIGFRLAGKRELAQTNTMDLVVLLILSNTVQNAIIGNDNTLIGGIVGGIALLIVNHFLVNLCFKKPAINALVEGRPEVLIQNGQIQEETLKQELITLSELKIAAQKQGFASLDEIETAVLESGGSFEFHPKQKPTTAAEYLAVIHQLEAIQLELKAIKTHLAQ